MMPSHAGPAIVLAMASAMLPVRILVVDDHPLFSETLAARLGSEPNLRVLPVAATVEQAEALIAREEPAVVLLDYTLGDRCGLDVLDAIRDEQQRPQVVMLSASTEVGPVVDSLRLGARAWVCKSVEVRQLVAIINTVIAGGAWLSPELLALVLDELVREPDQKPDGLAALTAREREVLQCMVDGLPRAEIAAHLFLSANTVRTHTQNLLAKLDCHSALEAVAFARRNGMRPLGQAPTS